jgi:hypothetical protein
VCNAARRDGVAEGAGDVLLFYDVGKRLGAVFAGEYEIGHTGITSCTRNNTGARNAGGSVFQGPAGCSGGMAERVGFEPTVPVLAAHTISSRVPSASSDISPQICRMQALALP